MSAYDHDAAMSGHAKQRGLVTVTDEHGTVQTGTLVCWRPRNKYTARVRIADHLAPFTFRLTRYTVEPA